MCSSQDSGLTPIVQGVYRLGLWQDHFVVFLITEMTYLRVGSSAMISELGGVETDPDSSPLDEDQGGKFRTER